MVWLMWGFAGGCHGGMTDKAAPAVRRPSPKHVLETEENQTSLAVGRSRREVKIDSPPRVPASRPRPSVTAHLLLPP